MKKLEVLGRSLTSSEMKAIGGGKMYLCTATAQPGYTVTQPGSCDGTFENCNTACDNWCVNTTGCSTCTCR